MKTADTKRITEPLRHDLSDHEIAAIARNLNIVTQDRERLKDNFDSLKADYKAKDSLLELEISAHLRKINDGFEMRPVELEVSFNDPERGRKTTRRLDTGETVRVEAMTPLDVEQKPLPGMEDTPSIGALVCEVCGELRESCEGRHGEDFAHPNLTENGERTGTLSQTEGAENAGEVSVGDVLVKAALEAKEPLVPLNLAKFGSSYNDAWKAFKKEAKAQGWKTTSIELIHEQICAISARERKEQIDLSDSAFALLAPHVTEE